MDHRLLHVAAGRDGQGCVRLEVSLTSLRAWTPEQAQAASAILAQGERSSPYHRKDILVVLPTGAGKTLTWLVAGQSDDPERLIVVIVPLNGLLLDISSRLEKSGCLVHLNKPGVPLNLERLSGVLLISMDRIV